MAKRKRIYISPEKKKQIIKGLLENDSDIKLLATKYQVTAKTLGKWRRDNYKAEKGRELTKPDQHFVEVRVGKDIKKNHLKKVELILDNHKCSIEGRLNSEQLIKLLELLEEASC
jgi:transposase-like protein